MDPIMDDMNDFPEGYYWYAQRWYDGEGVPHYHGVRSGADHIAEAQATMRFNRLASPVDLVYGPCDLDELYEFLGDVLANPMTDDSDSDIGSLDWLI